MNCARLQQVLDAHIDGELDHTTTREITDHLVQCSDCATLHQQRNNLRHALRAHTPYYDAPATLAPTLRRALRAAQGEAPPRRGASWWLPMAAVATVAALAGLAVGYWLAQPQPDLPLRESAVASHFAALAPQRLLIEVASGDRHTVKPWFQGKVDFSPPVKDLSGEGFMLLGGRLDRVADRPAAAVVYQIRKHVINLYVWRASDRKPDAIGSAGIRGFSVTTWANDGLRFAAVSDVDVRDLTRFAQLMSAP